MAIIILIDVVFPAPLGPMNPYKAPRGTNRSRSQTALVVPKVFVTRVRRMAGSTSVANGRFIITGKAKGLLSTERRQP
jgi:hypothetical protein